MCFTRVHLFMMFNMKSIANCFSSAYKLWWYPLYQCILPGNRWGESYHLSPLGCANVFTWARGLYDLSKHFQVAVVLSSFQLQNSKILLVDLLKWSITNAILEFQSSHSKQGRTRLDDSLISSLIRVFVFIIQSVQVWNITLSYENIYLNLIVIF